MHTHSLTTVFAGTESRLPKLTVEGIRDAVGSEVNFCARELADKRLVARIDPEAAGPHQLRGVSLGRGGAKVAVRASRVRWAMVG